MALIIDGWKLVRDGSQEPVEMDETIVDFRGNATACEGGQPPRSPGSTGRVWTPLGEHYPEIFNLKWVRV